MKKRVCTIFLLLALALTAFGLSTAAEEVPEASGTIGSISWSFAEDTGTLTISGQGKMPDFNATEELPWYPIRSEITSLVVEKGLQPWEDGLFPNVRNWRRLPCRTR